MIELQKDYTLVFITSDDGLVLDDLIGSGEALADLQRGLAHYLLDAKNIWVEARSSVEVKPIATHLNAFVLPIRVHATASEDDYDLGGFADCVEAALNEFLRKTNPTLVDYPGTVQLVWDEA